MSKPDRAEAETSANLILCPFCGEADSLDVQHVGWCEEGHVLHAGRCLVCASIGPPSHDGRGAADDLWNSRTPRAAGERLQ